MKLLAIAVAFALLSGAAPPSSKTQYHFAEWVVVGQQPASRTVTVKRNAPFEFARIVPRTLYRLDEDAIAANGVLALHKGSLMVPVSGPTKSACLLLREVGSAFSCLTDSDGDGKFDSYFGTQVFNEIFFRSDGDGGFQGLAHPVGWTAIDPMAETPHIGLEFTYEGGSDGELRYGLNTVIVRDKIVFGRDWKRKGTSTSTIAERAKFTLTGGNPLEVFGARLTFSHVTGNTIDITIVPSAQDLKFSNTPPALNTVF